MSKKPTRSEKKTLYAKTILAISMLQADADAMDGYEHERTRQTELQAGINHLDACWRSHDVLERALKTIAEMTPKPPKVFEYDGDTGEAEAWGMLAGQHECSKIARRALRSAAAIAKGGAS